MKTIIMFLAAIIIAAITSCSIEKRHYRNGFNIEWNKKNKAAMPVTSLPGDRNSLTASSDKEIIPIVEHPLPLINNNEVTPIPGPVLKVENIVTNEEIKTTPIPLHDSCDVIYYGENEVISAHIVQVNSVNVKYFWCNDTDEIIEEIPDTDIIKIVFSDGTVLQHQDIIHLKTKIVNPVASKYDIIFTSRGRIKGQLIAFSKYSFKFIDSKDSAHNEIELPGNQFKKMELGNGEVIVRDEISLMEKSLTTRDEILKYTETIEFKKSKVESLIAYTHKLGRIFFLPVIGLPTDIKSTAVAHRALSYIKQNPELNSYEPKVKKASKKARFGIVLSILFAVGLTVAFFVALADSAGGFL